MTAKMKLEELLCRNLSTVDYDD